MIETLLGKKVELVATPQHEYLKLLKTGDIFEVVGCFNNELIIKLPQGKDRILLPSNLFKLYEKEKY